MAKGTQKYFRENFDNTETSNLSPYFVNKLNHVNEYAS